MASTPSATPSPQRPLTIDHLGVFCGSGGVLAWSHPVAIWDSTGALVPGAETTVYGGDVDYGGDEQMQIGQFCYHKLGSPVKLAPGTYTIGALYSVENGATDDPLVYNAKNFASIPQVTIGKAMYAAGDTLMTPNTESNAGPGYFGPNFAVWVVPEPSSLTLAATAALGLTGYLWPRRKQGRTGKAGTARPA